MDRKRIIYLILALIPVLFLMFLLAMVNVLAMLLAVAALLGGLLLLKRFKPEWFAKPGGPQLPSIVPPSWAQDPPSEKPKVYMVLSGREYVGAKRIQVNKTTYTIGRDADNDFCINDPCVGRHHCRIEYDPVENTCYAIDNGSVNSTYLNSERLTAGQRCRLIQGDRIRIADREFEVEYANF